MKITANRSGEALALALEGRLDSVTAPQLEALLQRELPGTKELTLDLAALEYISSAGLRVVLMAQKAMNRQGRMVVRNVGGVVGEVFEIAGFTDILTIQ